MLEARGHVSGHDGLCARAGEETHPSHLQRGT